MEVYFDYSVETDKPAHGEYATVQEAKDAATADWQSKCEEGDYEFGKGEASIYVIDAVTQEAVLCSTVYVYSERPRS